MPAMAANARMVPVVQDPDVAAERFMLETLCSMLDHEPEHIRIGWFPN